MFGCLGCYVEHWFWIVLVCVDLALWFGDFCFALLDWLIFMWLRWDFACWVLCCYGFALMSRVIAFCVWCDAWVFGRVMV